MMFTSFNELVKIPVRIKQAKEIQDIQAQALHPTTDEYTRGLFNGMELALSIIENREPIYKHVEKRP